MSSPQPPQPLAKQIIRLFLLILSSTLALLRSSELLGSILSLLPLLSRSPLDLSSLSHSDESVSRFELLHGLNGVVDQGEASGLAATVLSTHAEDVDLVSVGLVNFGEFCS